MPSAPSPSSPPRSLMAYAGKTSRQMASSLAMARERMLGSSSRVMACSSARSSTFVLWGSLLFCMCFSGLDKMASARAASCSLRLSRRTSTSSCVIVSSGFKAGGAAALATFRLRFTPLARGTGSAPSSAVAGSSGAAAAASAAAFSCVLNRGTAVPVFSRSAAAWAEVTCPDASFTGKCEKCPSAYRAAAAERLYAASTSSPPAAASENSCILPPLAWGAERSQLPCACRPTSQKCCPGTPSHTQPVRGTVGG